jgi:tetratricopeptide (TPR) repeat protein
MHKKSSLKRKENKGKKGKHTTSSPQPEAKGKKAGSGRPWYFLLTLVMLFTLAGYSNGLRNQFVFDDNLLITNNPAMRGVEKIPGLLGVGKKRAQYRPLRMISYAVDYTLNQKFWKHVGSYEGWDEGLNPLGYHLANCVYHLLTAWLVFLVVFRLAANYRIAFLAAALFALHPVHTDSVTYLSGRRDILVTLFYLAGFYYFLRYRQTGKITFIVAAFLSYLLSLGSKEMGVTLPALFLSYDLITHFPEKVRRIDAAYVKEFFRTVKKVLVKSRYLYSLIFLGALSFSYYKVFITSPSKKATYYGDSMITTFLTVGKILVHYIKLLVYPIRLNADYSFDAFPLSSSFLEPATAGAFMVLGVIGYVVLRLVITHRMAAFGVIWFFVTLLPVCHIFPHHELLAEHYLYLPSFGFCLLAGYLLERLLKDTPYRFPVYASFVLVLLLFSLRTADRNRDWKDGFSLWAKTVRTAPRCARAHVNLGNAHYRQGRLDESILAYKRGLSIRPQYVKGYVNLGEAYVTMKKFDEAIAEHKKALALKPNSAEGHAGLGAAYLEKGMLDEAILELEQALAIKSYYAVAHANLCAAYQVKGMFDEAITECTRALGIDPTLTIAYINLGIAYGKKGLLDQAISQFANALRTNPDSVDAYYYRAIAHDEKGMLDEAIADFKKALTYAPNSVNARFKLGMVYSKRGMQDEANAQFKEAFTLQAARKGSTQLSIPPSPAKRDTKTSSPSPEAPTVLQPQ